MSALSRDEAVMRLAERLHWKMEQLDPTDTPDWETLTARQREFYRLCIEAIFDEREPSKLALK